MGQINNSFGSGGMSLAFNEMQFAAFVQFLKTHNSVNIRTAATIVGQQSCGQVWVMGETQIDAEGEVMAPNTSPYIWLDKMSMMAKPASGCFRLLRYFARCQLLCISTKVCRSRKSASS